MCLGYTNTNIDLDRFSPQRGRPGYEEVVKTIVKEFFNMFLLVGTQLFIQQIPYNFKAVPRVRSRRSVFMYK